jgi:hypothetical protein
VSFTAEQTEHLLRAINPRRVLHENKQAHLSQQDVRAHLIRVFGFAGWDKEILSLECIRDEWIDLPAQGDRPARTVPAVTYVCRLRLTVYCPDRCCRKISEDVGTGTSPNLPYYGDAHDFAVKNAVSYALKRCAIDMGDQFGLSLYNKGQTKALVGRTLVGADEDVQLGTRRQAVDADVPQQVSLGDTEDGGDGGGGAEPVVEPREQILPARAPGTALRRAYEAAIARYAGVLGIGGPELRGRFENTYSVTIEDATEEELSAFADTLRSDAEQLARYEDPDDPEAVDQEAG